ncbi:LytTR family transcriptional regulator DNA-binding domain-containing protein [Paenibacillus sp. NPDC057886]|uniref:LytTR family transcriptional regulator DNA-binding domain-containing protein n=1 Tax=Paenibacillus sp. NPDC057886 TaxID=3346270 RepID=UPI0036C1CD56
MNIPVIDIETKEIKMISVDEVLYILRSGINGSIQKVSTENGEYRLLSETEFVKYLTDTGHLKFSDGGVAVNLKKVKRIDPMNRKLVFSEGIEASVSTARFKEIEEDILNLT